MRLPLVLCLIVSSFALAARATTYPATTQDKEKVDAVLKTINDDDPTTLDAAEDALVKLGDVANRTLPMFLENPKPSQKPMLVIAAFRLAHEGANPREAVAKWMKDNIKQPLPFTAAPVVSDALPKVFPDTVFYTWTARQFPVARLVPQPLHDQNIFAIDARNNVTHIASANDLEAYFKKHLPPIKDIDNATAADATGTAQAWGALTQEFSQDGMFQFHLGTITATGSDEKHPGIEAQVVINVDKSGGNKGSITATLTFDKDGKLASVKETRNVRQGIRPVCQATKLLDPDPVIRKMSERDILVMGRGCRPYLLEQRQKASPELQKAIDAAWQKILDDER